MRLFPLAAMVMVPALGAASSLSAAVVYSQTSTTGLTSNFVLSPDALDDVNFAAGSTATSAQRLSAITLGAAVAPGTTAQTAVVFVNFYDVLDPASTGAVESNLIGGFGGNLTIAANAGTSPAFRAFSFSALTGLSTPIDFTDDNIAVEITFADAAGANLSTILSNLSSVPGVPTVGSSITGTYRDSSNDGDFQATEFNPATGNLYLSLTTVNAPEPMSAALLLPAFALVRRRRAAK